MTLLFADLATDFVTFSNLVLKLIIALPLRRSAFLALLQHLERVQRVAPSGPLVRLQLHQVIKWAFIHIIGFGTLVAAFIYMLTFVYTGDVGAKRIREKYFRATLHQGIAYFDEVGAGEVATHIQTDTRKQNIMMYFSPV